MSPIASEMPLGGSDVLRFDVPLQAAQSGDRHGSAAEVAQLPLGIQLQTELEEPFCFAPFIRRPLAEFFCQGIHDLREPA